MESLYSPEAERLLGVTSGGQFIPENSPEALEYEAFIESTPPEHSPPPAQNEPLQRQAQIEHRKRKASSDIPGYFCFSFGASAPRVPQRARYSDARSREVKEIRTVGACLRCRLLKRPCSKGNPCERCIKAATIKHASRCLGWMQCIRPPLKKLNIFAYDTSILQQQFTHDTLDRFIEADVHMSFAIPFDWEIESMYNYFVHWLVTESESPVASVVGIMSSKKFCGMISQFVGPSLAGAFKLLVYATSVLYNDQESFEHQYQAEDLTNFIGYAGDNVVRSLEALLEPNALAQSPRQKLGTLFLVLLGTIIATGYVSTKGISYQIGTIGTNVEAQRQANEVKNDELIRLLCHYLVYVGQKSLILPSAWNEKAAIDLAKSQWDKRPAFVWQFDPTQPSTTSRNDAVPYYNKHGMVQAENDAGRLPWEDLINWPEEKGIDGVLDPMQVPFQYLSSCGSYSGDDIEKETYNGVEEQQEDFPADNLLKPNNPDERNQAQAPEGTFTSAQDIRKMSQNETDKFRPLRERRACYSAVAERSRKCRSCGSFLINLEPAPSPNVRFHCTYKKNGELSSCPSYQLWSSYKDTGLRTSRMPRCRFHPDRIAQNGVDLCQFCMEEHASQSVRVATIDDTSATGCDDGIQAQAMGISDESYDIPEPNHGGDTYSKSSSDQRHASSPHAINQRFKRLLI